MYITSSGKLDCPLIILIPRIPNKPTGPINYGDVPFKTINQTLSIWNNLSTDLLDYYLFDLDKIKKKTKPWKKNKFSLSIIILFLTADIDLKRYNYIKYRSYFNSRRIYIYNFRFIISK